MRDPSKFRLRFKEYKEGKSVREIYGLPGYQDGTTAEDTTIPYEKDGVLYNINPNVVGAEQINITTPEITVTGRDLTKPYRSAYLFNDLTLNEAIRQRMYNTITPVGYNLWDSVRDFITGPDRKIYDPFREALWAKYLGLDYYKNTDGSLGEVNKAIVPSTYKMKVGAPTYGPNIYTFNPDIFKYSPLSNPLHPENMRTINLRMDRDNKNFVLNIEDLNNPQAYNSGASGLGTFVYGRGKDANGRYMTYYDDWDLNWFEGGIRKLDLPDWIMKHIKGDLLAPFGLGHPFTLADKAYYKNGKLPGYQKGLTPLQIEETIVKNQGTIQQGHHWSPLSTVANSMYRDYRKPFALLFTEGGLGNFARGLLQLLDSWNKEARGIADAIDHANVLLDIFTMGEASLAKLSAKQAIREAKAAAKKAIKPTKASIKEPKLSAPEVAEYHKANPKLVKPALVTPEVLKAIDYTYDRANRLSKEPLEKVNLNMHSAKFPENTNISAYATPYGTVFDEAYIKEMQKMGIMVPHEYEHLLQQQIKYTPEQASILEQAFPFSSDWLQAHKDFDLLKERGAMNSELAYAIGKKYGFPVGKQFDSLVKRMPNDELEEIASGLSAYNKHSSELRMARPNVWPDVPSPNPAWNPLVRALTKVPATITVPLLAESQLDEYKDGKISINPANRGKFNATKKRTGKTTEELTHSKNPLTRKRAIFALNAKKWHHANGKLPRYGDGIIGDIVDAYDKFVETDPYNIATMMSFLPIIGTGMDIREAVKNPTAENIGYATLSGITDVVGGRIFAKLAGTAMKAKKAAKAARKAEYEFWKDTPFILNKPKAEAKRTLKFYMDRAADNAYDNVVSDPTFRVPDFEIAAGLGAGYGLDFVANINLHKQNK